MVKTLMYPASAFRPITTRKPRGERDGKEQIQRMNEHAIDMNMITGGGVFGDVDFIMHKPYRF